MLTHALSSPSFPSLSLPFPSHPQPQDLQLCISSPPTSDTLSSLPSLTRLALRCQPLHAPHHPSSGPLQRPPPPHPWDWGPCPLPASLISLDISITSPHARGMPQPVISSSVQWLSALTAITSLSASGSWLRASSGAASALRALAHLQHLDLELDTRVPGSIGVSEAVISGDPMGGAVFQSKLQIDMVIAAVADLTRLTSLRLAASHSAGLRNVVEPGSSSFGTSNGGGSPFVVRAFSRQLSQLSRLSSLGRLRRHEFGEALGYAAVSKWCGGGTMGTLSTLTSLVLHFSCLDHVTDEELAGQISPLTLLRHLEILGPSPLGGAIAVGPRFSGAGLAAIAERGRLRCLVLRRCCAFGAPGLRAARLATALARLDLSHCGLVDDAALSQLRGLTCLTGEGGGGVCSTAEV